MATCGHGGCGHRHGAGQGQASRGGGNRCSGGRGGTLERSDGGASAGSSRYLLKPCSCCQES